MQDALKNGPVAKRVSVNSEEVRRIRAAERKGGHDAGLVTVLTILREKNRARARERAKLDAGMK